MKVACVAIVGKSNNPLYIKSFDSNEDSLKFHYIVHSSLDVVEEKVYKDGSGKKAASPAASTDMYLGLLYPTEDYKVYGYMTNTKIKFIAVLLDDQDIKDADVKNLMKWVHGQYTGQVLNAFYAVDAPLASPRFDRILDKHVKAL